MREYRQYLPLQNIAFPFVAVAAATAFLYFASPIVIPVVIAVSLAYLLSPAVLLLKKVKIPHPVAVVLVLIIASVVLGVIGYLLFVQVNSLILDLPVYWNAVVEFSAKFFEEYREFFPQADGLDAKSFKLQDFSGATKYLFRGISSTISFLFSVVLVLFLTFFILNDQSMLKNKLLRAFSRSKERTGAKILEKINAQIRGFLLVKFGTSLGLAVIFTLGLLIIGVNYAYVWGPLAGILNLIPYVGPIIGAIPPLIVAAVQFKAVMPVVWVLILFLVFQNLEGNVITPKLMGDRLNLSPLAILVSVMFWTWLWGAIGIILAIPITASAKVICDHVEALQPIGILLGGKGDR
ncbi:MAG: AI-2E family transporter, partial [candidate division Zixibacteria bacterium]|nr:AI-2E family transporter [candidate division Zixibacteria bacterium]